MIEDTPPASDRPPRAWGQERGGQEVNWHCATVTLSTPGFRGTTDASLCDPGARKTVKTPVTQPRAPGQWLQLYRVPLLPGCPSSCRDHSRKHLAPKLRLGLQLETSVSKADRPGWGSRCFTLKTRSPHRGGTAAARSPVTLPGEECSDPAAGMTHLPRSPPAAATVSSGHLDTSPRRPGSAGRGRPQVRARTSRSPAPPPRAASAAHRGLQGEPSLAPELAGAAEQAKQN